ncbi:MAG: HDOD domain-containing protein [Desulfovibrionaceae bacterium]
MKRILFVDDEIMVLKGLRRMLSPLRAEWDMQFSDNAEDALAIMAHTPVDVLVTDWHMPNTNGVCLLQEVARKHGGTVRIILSGQSLGGQGDCMFHAHQVLYKPCDFATLQAVIQGIGNTDALLGNGLVKQETARLHALPPLPAVYQEVVREMGKPVPALPRIAAIIRCDPAISSRILGIVNSISFGLRSRVSSLEHAIAMLGLNTVRSIIVAMHCVSIHDAAPEPSFSLSMLWDHCIRTAGLVKTLASQSKKEKDASESCFIGGMLHDMGKIALAALFPKEYAHVIRSVQQDALTVFEAERLLFGTTHADVGAYILGLWGMPESIVNLVATHHAPDRITTDRGAMIFTANAMDHKRYIIHADYTARDDTAELEHHPRFAAHLASWTALSDTYYAEMTPDEEQGADR